MVVVGGGFGGLEAAKALGRAGVEVTLIDRRNHHLFQPLLYQVATAALSPADIAEPIRRLLRRYPSVEMRLGEVTGVDLAARRVTIADQPGVGFDHLIIATGSGPGYFGHDDWARIAPGLKTIEDARLVRSRILVEFERAELETAPGRQQQHMTTVIVGGGPTGVELAGAVADLARNALRRDFRRISPQSARIILIEAGPRLLTGFSEETSAYAKAALERRGVEVVLGTHVDGMFPDRVVAGERVIHIGTVIWAAGMTASAAGEWLGVATDRQGRVPVGADFSVGGRDGIYVIGDTACVEDENGEPLPGLAQVAKQQGRHLGRALAARLVAGQPPERFRFRNRGIAAIIGRNEAVFEFASGRRLSGSLAWLLWAIVHIGLLAGYENRLLVSLQWLWRWLTHERGARLIEDEPPVSPRSRQGCGPPPRRPDGPSPDGPTSDGPSADRA